MDPSHEIPYKVADKNLSKKEPSFSHDDIKQLATNTADISHIKEQISDVKGTLADLGEIRTTVAEVKTDMRMMNSGVNASIMSMKSAFTNKLEHNEKQTKIYLESLEGKIDENNSHFKFLRGFIFKLVLALIIAMVSSTGIGLVVNAKIQTSNIEKINISDSVMVARIIKEINKSIKK